MNIRRSLSYLVWFTQFLTTILQTSTGFDDHTDFRRVCMNLVGKYEEIDALEGHKQQEESPSGIRIAGKHLFETASLGDPCDMDLYNKWISPIYSSTSRADELSEIGKLNQHLEEHPELVKKSCFGLTYDYRGKFYKCRSSRNGSESICMCMDEDPWLFQRVSKDEDSSECALIPSQIGDTCDGARMKIFNQKLYIPHYEAMKTADYDARKTEKELIHFGKEFIESCRWAFSVGDIRSMCLGVTLNLECKENNKCGCLDEDPYYAYTTSTKSGNYCLAKRGSVCLFEPKTKDGTPVLLRSARCLDKLECSAPVLQPEYEEFDFHAFQVCAGTSSSPSWLFIFLLLYLLSHFSTT